MAPINGVRGDAGDERSARQWRAWSLSRRGLLRTTGLAAFALGVAPTLALPGTAATVSAQDAEPKAGGTLTMSLADDDVRSFDPISVTDNMSIWTQLLVYDQLVRVAADGISLEPGLAESWEISEDGKTYTFVLRETTFHDGSPVTAEDAAFSLDRAINSEGSQWSFLFGAVETIEATGERTLEIGLSSPWAPFEADLALFGTSIIPKALYEAQGEELWQAPVGSGPFMFDSWNKGVEVVLKKNPTYWIEGQPYLDELRFLVLTDANARMLQFQGGELDIATDAPFSQLEALRANPDVVVLQDAVARFDYLGINTTRAPFDDKALRQAMNYAVNKDVIIQNVLFGAGQPANTYLPLMYGHDDSVPGYPYDLEKAKELVAGSAGKDGFGGTILLSAGDPVAAQIAQLVAADLAQIGGTFTIEQLDPGAHSDRTYAIDYDLNKSYYTTDIIDPDELTTFAVQSDGGADSVWTGYKNEEVDKLVRDAQAEMDPEVRLGIYAEIQKLVSDDAHMLYLYYPTGRTALTTAIQNFRILPTGNYRLWETWRSDV